MTTLRRILKYTPAVVLGLLVVIWIAGWFWTTAIAIPIEPQGIVILSGGGDLVFGPIESRRVRRLINVGRNPYSPYPVIVLGRLTSRPDDGFPAVIPVPLLLTLLLPLAIGPFRSFRFRLWHYLAYTAVVAVELAYYLQWQG